MSVAAGLALLGGGGWFTWQLDLARRDAVDNARAAQTNEEKARTNEERAKAALAQAEQALAVGLLRPVGHSTSEITEFERDALWELACQPPARERVRLLFLERGFQAVNTAQQLERRLPQVLVATVGLDRARAEEVRRLLLRFLNEPTLDWQIKRALALAVVELGLIDDETCRAAAPAFAAALDKATYAADFKTLAEGLARVSGNLERKDAARLHAAAADRLAGALEKEGSGVASNALAAGLAALAPRLEGEDASRVAGRLSKALSKAMSLETVAGLAEGLVVATARLEPKEAAWLHAEAADQFAGKMIGGTSLFQHPLETGLTVVAARLAPKEVVRVADRLAEVLGKQDSRFVDTTNALAALARRLDPTDTARLTAQLTEFLGKHLEADQVKKRAPGSQVAACARGVAAVAAALGPADADRLCGAAATQVAQALAACVGPSVDPNAVKVLSECLAALKGRLPPAEAAKVAERLADSLVRESYNIGPWAKALAAVAVWLEPAAAADVGKRLSAALAKSTVVDASHPLAEGLAALAARLDAKQANQLSAAAADRLVNTFTKEALPRDDLADGLAALAPWLEPEDARKAADRIAPKLDEPSTHKRPLVKVLVAMALRLEPRDAARIGERLGQELDRTLIDPDMDYLVRGLAAVARRLGGEEAAKLEEGLARALAKARYPHLAKPLAEGLAATGRLDLQKAAWLLRCPACVGPARDILMRDLERQTGQTFETRWDLVEWLRRNRPSIDLVAPPGADH